MLTKLRHCFSNHTWCYLKEKGHCNKYKCKDPYTTGKIRRCKIKGCNTVEEYVLRRGYNTWNQRVEWYEWQEICSREANK